MIQFDNAIEMSAELFFEFIKNIKEPYATKQVNINGFDIGFTKTSKSVTIKVLDYYERKIIEITCLINDIQYKKSWYLQMFANELQMKSDFYNNLSNMIKNKM